MEEIVWRDVAGGELMNANREVKRRKRHTAAQTRNRRSGNARAVRDILVLEAMFKHVLGKQHDTNVHWTHIGGNPRCTRSSLEAQSRPVHATHMEKRKRRPTFIRAWRRHRGYTLENLAERVGITHASLSRIERGEQPFNQDLLELLADALMVEPADLLMRDPADPGGLWSIWDQAKPGERRQILDIARVIVGDKTGTDN